MYSSSPCDHLEEDTWPKITSKWLKADRLLEELSDLESLEELLPLFCPVVQKQLIVVREEMLRRVVINTVAGSQTSRGSQSHCSC